MSISFGPSIFKLFKLASDFETIRIIAYLLWYKLGKFTNLRYEFLDLVINLQVGEVAMPQA